MSGECIFSKIYKNNAWKGEESRSGPSSGMERTRVLRETLPNIIKKYKISTFLDIPCGDFYWMKSVPIDVDYVGGDIVSEVIEKNNLDFSTNRKKFIHTNLVEDSLPKGDLLFCRDCLFHLSYGDIAKVFQNILHSEVKYIMLTSHITDQNFQNKDIKTGQWRWFDLTKTPFCIPESLCLEKVMDGGGDRYMLMWRVDEITEFLKNSIELLRD